MSRHRAVPPSRRAEPARRRASAPGPVRPRYGRLAALGASVSVTAVALLGGTGVLPSVATQDDSPSASSSGDRASTVLSAADASATPGPSPDPDPASASAATTEAAPAPPADPAVPADSGEGKRVVFDQSDQRVWLVNDDEQVVRTYLVSGSASDNLEPGSFEVYSRSANAVGVDDSGTMQYFVRFTQGTNGAAIGFHDIPVDDGEPVQTTDQLGTPLSHGCIRQARKDALALWGFAPIGTEVTVTA